MKQIIIVTDNRPGVVAEISKVLGERGINIETLAAETMEETGVVILTVDRYDEALTALRDASFDAVTEDAIVVRIKDEPGALARLAQRFKEADINLRSVRIIRRMGGWGLVAISTDRTAEAMDLVKDMRIS